MKKSYLHSSILAGAVLLLNLLTTSQTCWAVFVYFDGSASSDFLVGANWSPENAPGTNLADIYGIDDGLSSTFTGGVTTTINGLRVGSVAKEHQFGDTHFGRLTMTNAALEVIGTNTLSIGREREANPFGGDYNKNGVVDAADFTVWRNTLGSTTDLRADGDKNGAIETLDYDYWKGRFGKTVKGGELIMTGTSTIKANGMLVGERTNGLLSIGPTSAVDIRIWDTAVVPAQFGGTEDLRVGGYGPAFDDFGAEPGLAGDGLVVVQGTLNAKDLYLSEHGGKGEIRLSGGTVNMNGALHMDFCGNCVTDPALLGQRSSKVTIVGSSGAFNVGLDPDPMVVDPLPPVRDLLAVSTTAKFSFTADAGGVTPIVLPDNGVEISGFARINTSKLELNLDAYLGAAPLTLINAAPGHLAVGTFGAVTFLGSRMATVNYDVASGDVFLSNFHSGAGSGALAGAAVPEPSSLVIVTTLGFFMIAFGAGANRQRRLAWGHQCLKIRA